MDEKQNIMDKFADKVMVVANPLSRVAALPFMQALQRGFAQTLPILMFGSIFLILACACTGQLGFTIFPGLAQYVDKMYGPFNLCTGLLGFYACLAIGQSYAKELGMENPTSITLVVGSSFFFANYVGNDFSDVTAFSSSGAFASILVAFVSVRLYKFLIDHKVTINLPEMVPPAIANSFTDLIPTFVVLTVFWIFRTVLNLNITTIVSSCLAPLLSASDSLWGMLLNGLGSGIFWSVGIHWENMVSGITTPMWTQFLAENQAAAASGVALTQLPHIWVSGATLMSRVITHYPLLVLLLRSKVPGFKEMGIAAAIPAIFCICEPLTFGIPMVMNPYMIFPLIIVNVIFAILLWNAYAFGLLNRVFISAPWATPATLNLYLSSGGDWRHIVFGVIVFILGLIIYYPFFKAYEKATLKKIEEDNAQIDMAELEPAN